MNALIVIVPVGTLAIVWGVFREIAKAERLKNAVRPLTMDEQAAWGHYRIDDAAKVERMRYGRESARRHYEGITWPAIQWEVRRREILKYVRGA